MIKPVHITFWSSKFNQIRFHKSPTLEGSNPSPSAIPHSTIYEDYGMACCGLSSPQFLFYRPQQPWEIGVGNHPDKVCSDETLASNLQVQSPKFFRWDICIYRRWWSRPHQKLSRSLSTQLVCIHSTGYFSIKGFGN